MTSRGAQKLRALTVRREVVGDFPDISNYSKASGNQLIIFAFDIPEHYRQKRAWLRAVLRNLGLKMLQKSVWIGRTKIPEIFLDDLRRLKMINYIEILAISKSGSLRQVI